jgi:hypothetical protein
VIREYILPQAQILRSYSTGSINLGDGVGSEMLGTGGLVGYAEGSAIKDSFSAKTFTRLDSQPSNGYSQVQGGGVIVPFGAIAGMFIGDNSDISNNAFDETISGTNACAGVSMTLDYDTLEINDSQCVGVNSDGSDASHFKANSTVRPFDKWNFSDVWESVDGQYPRLRPIVLGSDTTNGENVGNTDNSNSGTSNSGTSNPSANNSGTKNTGSKNNVNKTIKAVSENPLVTVDSPLIQPPDIKEIAKVLGDKKAIAQKRIVLKTSKSQSVMTNKYFIASILTVLSSLACLAFWLLKIRKNANDFDDSALYNLYDY